MPTSTVFNLRALVIDDHRTMRLIVRQLLGQMGIHDVIEADNGINAINLLAHMNGATPPDVIICDLHMEKMDGMEFLSHVRRGKTHVNVHTPILILTGEPDQFVLDVTAQVGATAILKKPITAVDLSIEIERAIGFAS